MWDLAAQFDNVETYPNKLGLNPAEQKVLNMLCFSMACKQQCVTL